MKGQNRMSDYKRPIKVLIVNPKNSKELLSTILCRDPELEIVGFVESKEEALNFLQVYHPDIIAIDHKLLQKNDFEIIRSIQFRYLCPIVAIGNTDVYFSKGYSSKAIEVGVLTFLQMPTGLEDPFFQEAAFAMIAALKAATKKQNRKFQHSQTPSLPLNTCSFHAIAIGASLGGPLAINKILSTLSNTFPIPIFIVQHFAPGFVEGFVDWLNSSTDLEVSIAEEGEQGLPGKVYVAPDKFHLEITKGNIMTLIDGKPEEGCKPSVAHLFRSMSRVHGKHGIGILLTGMGKDGAKDLLQMKEKGALTIAQNKESSVIFGMPDEAIQIGAASQVLSLKQIIVLLHQLVSKTKINL